MNGVKKKSSKCHSHTEVIDKTFPACRSFKEVIYSTLESNFAGFLATIPLAVAQVDDFLKLSSSLHFRRSVHRCQQWRNIGGSEWHSNWN